MLACLTLLTAASSSDGCSGPAPLCDKPACPGCIAPVAQIDASGRGCSSAAGCHSRSLQAAGGVEGTDFGRLFLEEVKRVSERPVACFMPERTILLTYSNSYHVELLLLQRKGIRLGGAQCLLRRFVVVCLDKACMQLCARHHIGSCVLYANELGRSDFDKGDYYSILLTKWELIGMLLAHNVSVLFLDDDVLLMKNPFTHFNATQYDFRYQTEHGSGCEAAANGGQMFFQASEGARRMVQAMMRQKDVILHGNASMLDQDLVLPTVAAVGATACALPKEVFTGHCMGAHEPDTDTTTVVTYHAHCCSYVNGKRLLMERFLTAALETGPHRLFGDVDRRALQHEIEGHLAWLPFRRRKREHEAGYTEMSDRMCFTEEDVLARDKQRAAEALATATAPVGDGMWGAEEGDALDGVGRRLLFRRLPL